MSADQTRNTELGAQKGYNTLADCMISQIRWHQSEVNPLGFLNFVRMYMEWSNGRKMDAYIGKLLDERYEDFKTVPEASRSKAVIDLVLQAYLPKDTKAVPEKLDPDFRTFAIRQIRLFVFVGHDSTSSTICYCFHLLSKNPAALARIRAEHDLVFGTDVSAVSSLLISQPHLINALPYTTAVIKETLRLFPPASASRQGKKSVNLTDEQGNICPTDGAMVLILHNRMQRTSKYWVRPDEFLPERWLVEVGHELYPMRNAWRPFEHGPRNCIAEGMVMTEIKLVLAHLAREFEFKDAYEEWDAVNPRKGPKTYRGERAYQVEQGAAHPAQNYPCRVSIRAN